MSERQQLLAARDRLAEALALLNHAMELLVLAALPDDPPAPTPIRPLVEDGSATARAAYDRYAALYDQVALETGIIPELEEPKSLAAVEAAIGRLKANRANWLGEPKMTDVQKQQIKALVGPAYRALPTNRLSSSGAAYLIAQLVHAVEERKQVMS